MFVVFSFCQPSVVFFLPFYFFSSIFFFFFFMLYVKRGFLRYNICFLFRFPFFLLDLVFLSSSFRICQVRQLKRSAWAGCHNLTYLWAFTSCTIRTPTSTKLLIHSLLTPVTPRHQFLVRSHFMFLSCGFFIFLDTLKVLSYVFIHHQSFPACPTLTDQCLLRLSISLFYFFPPNPYEVTPPTSLKTTVQHFQLASSLLPRLLHLRS